VKASGGILYYEDAVAMLDAGATRLGMSHTQQVLDSIELPQM
jgi:deoxyribose-phosphate aldolase